MFIGCIYPLFHSRRDISKKRGQSKGGLKL
jgi:hypothetical protein